MLAMTLAFVCAFFIALLTAPKQASFTERFALGMIAACLSAVCVFCFYVDMGKW
jgi:hypothetical protein